MQRFPSGFGRDYTAGSRPKNDDFCNGTRDNMRRDGSAWVVSPVNCQVWREPMRRDFVLTGSVRRSGYNLLYLPNKQ